MVSLGATEGHDNLHSHFESLGNELSIRSQVLTGAQASRRGAGFQRIKLEAATFRYASLRLSDLFDRLELLEWIRREIAKVPELERIQAMTGPIDEHPWMWNVFAGLTIKDFHADVSSTMDAIAPLVIYAFGEVKKGDTPGFADIQKGTKRTYRERLPQDCFDIIDATNTWWPIIKKVRDTLVHRDHFKLVFPGLGDDESLLFLAENNSHVPLVTEQRLMFTKGRNVIDLTLYTGLVVAHLLAFMDEISKDIAQNMNISSPTPSVRLGDFRRLAYSWERLTKPQD